MTRELGVALGATVVSFLIADLSGRARVRLAYVPLHQAEEKTSDETLAPGERREAEESATVLPFDGGPAEQAVRTQTAQVLAPDEPHPGRARADQWTVRPGDRARGGHRCPGTLSPRGTGPRHGGRDRPARTSPGVRGDREPAARGWFEWGQRSRLSSASAQIQQRLLPGPRTCEAGAFALPGWLEPAAQIAGDTFDYSQARDLLHLSMTDAMGHGVAAALTATLCVGGLRARADKARRCSNRQPLRTRPWPRTPSTAGSTTS